MLLLPVSWCTQCENNWICYFYHWLQGWGHHDEEDDAEEEGALQCLHIQQACLNGEEEQSDALSHTSENKNDQELRWNKNKGGIAQRYSFTLSVTCAWHSHSEQRQNLPGKTCIDWAAPEPDRTPWRSDPKESMVLHNIQRHCRVQANEKPMIMFILSGLNIPKMKGM